MSSILGRFLVRKTRSLGTVTLLNPIQQSGFNPAFNPALKMSSSGETKKAGNLADSIMTAKVKAEKSEKDEKADSNDGEKPKGAPEPLPKWQKIGYWTLGILMGGSIIGNAIVFSLPDRDEDGNNIKDEYSELPFPSQHYQRLKNKFFKTKKEMEDPFSDKLLPDPLQEPFYQPKYTILVELTGLLVHSNWTHKYGWRFQKRPGLDMFLSQLGYPNFELIVYTTENPMTFHPIIDSLDPQNQFIVYRLYRPATRYIDGHHKKDLSVLNRDLKRVIVVDWNENSVDLNRENALVLPKWEGDNGDRNLIGLAQLLQTIRETDVDDVRDVLHYYKQFDNPIDAFRENQRKLQEEMSALEEKRKQQETKGQSVSRFTGLSAFARR